ncbi:hypothetical protein HNY73_011115 [Argiope bruennichi]|uniref:Uncharacterized protein n=1 Tax=Argiope bruennichi TaxID=94029 RepID=A0A8T0F360_ARGBR|nr:hypothetical protein HNY73_011115 [Argiope bruennichi]
MSITSWLRVVQFVAGKFLFSYVREKFRVLKLFRNSDAKLLLKCDIIRSLQHPRDAELRHVVIREALERRQKDGKVPLQFNFVAPAGDLKMIGGITD